MSQPRGVSKKPTISQQPDKRDWIPIIVGAIAALLGGGILASIFNSLISYVNAPNVQILIKPDGKRNGNNAWILMVNSGGAAAKHVKLMVSAPKEIIGYDNFSTENMTLEKPKPKPTILEGNMQRFVQGAGSFVNISLTIKANLNHCFSGPGQQKNEKTCHFCYPGHVSFLAELQKSYPPLYQTSLLQLLLVVYILRKRFHMCHI
ncbi:MAG: hypothetical protein WBZ20_09270 [Nitrososphaeraceae archaeon]